MSTSVGTVVDLAGNSVKFSTAAQINATAWLASDAKTFLVGQLELAQKEYRISAGDGNDCGVLTVSGYRVADLIDGGEFGVGEPNCAGGGATILWGKIAGKWGVVIGGQSEPVCSDDPEGVLRRPVRRERHTGDLQALTGAGLLSGKDSLLLTIQNPC